MKTIHRTFWKIYFIAFAALSLAIFKDYFDIIPNLTFRDFFELLFISPVSLLGLFAYSFRKKIFNKKFWRGFFWFLFIDTTLYGIYSSEPGNKILSFFYKSNLPSSSEEYSWYLLLFGLAVIAPFFYAIFRLGYPKTPKPSIEWIILVTDKYEESKDFYLNTLGFKIEREIKEDLFCQFSLKNLKLAIYDRSNLSKTIDKKYLGKAGGAIYTMPETNDVDKEFAKLEEKGVKFIKPLATQPWGQRTAYFRDPDGHIWEIQQWVK